MGFLHYYKKKAFSVTKKTINKMQRSIAILLLLLMGYTHGGGLAFTQNCLPSSEKLTCATSNACCCSPDNCHCPDHHHTHLTSKKNILSYIDESNCSPIKKIMETGMDTSPMLISLPVSITVAIQSKTTPEISPTQNRSWTPPTLLHPPQLT